MASQKDRVAAIVASTRPSQLRVELMNLKMHYRASFIAKKSGLELTRVWRTLNGEREATLDDLEALERAGFLCLCVDEINICYVNQPCCGPEKEENQPDLPFSEEDQDDD